MVNRRLFTLLNCSLDFMILLPCFHDLRHTFATLAMQSGVDAKTLASMLGHYSAGFTLDTYTHVTHQMQQGAADKIGGFMEGVAASMPESEPPEPTSKSECSVIEFAQAI